MYIHCNFCLNQHITHGDMEENESGCFFSEHSLVVFVYCCHGNRGRSWWNLYDVIQQPNPQNPLLGAKHLGDISHTS